MRPSLARLAGLVAAAVALALPATAHAALPLTFDDVAPGTVSGNRRTATVKVRLAGVPRGGRAIVAVHVLRRGRVVATRTRTLTGRAARGLRSVPFRVVLADGRYAVRASAVAITGGALPSVERRVRTVGFRAR